MTRARLPDTDGFILAKDHTSVPLPTARKPSLDEQPSLVIKIIILGPSSRLLRQLLQHLPLDLVAACNDRGRTVRLNQTPGLQTPPLPLDNGPSLYHRQAMCITSPFYIDRTVIFRSAQALFPHI